ncbi:MAG: hypothetical protein HZB59_06590 [Ignavibacteriales bacterium]|nr:hypothetical protein [Ignavibacteriales bacterium]
MPDCISTLITDGLGLFANNFGTGTGESDRVDVSIEDICKIVEWEAVWTI